MKTCLSISLAGVMLLGLLSTGGCVSKEEHDKLGALNRRQGEELSRCQEALQEKDSANRDLLGRLQDLDQILAARQREIELLERARGQLQNDFNELKALYTNREMGAPPALPEIALPIQVDKALREFAAQYPELIEYLPRHGMVKFKADLTFDKGSDEVSPQAREALGKFAKIVNSAPAAEFNIYVAGHTDDIPIRKPDTLRRHPTNWYLSVHRSVAVQEELTKGGLSARRTGVLGFSEYHPVEPNATGNKGSQANRRVEIWIVPPDRFLTGASVSTASAEPAPAAPEK